MITRRIFQTFFSLSLSLATIPCGFSADESTFSPEDIKLYEEKVKPIFDKNCLKCHGGEKTKAEFRITSRGAVLRGGESGPAINSEKIDDSLLVKMINYVDDDHQMPPKQKLPAGDIAIITEWLQKGLPWTPGVIDENAEAKKPLITEESKNYWAYKKPIKSAIPTVSNAAWVINPIDAFVLANLDRNGLKPAPPASKETLIRRAYYDLLGLPPTAEDVAAFAADTDPNAYAKLIDKLLSSPHYGEKWGRHWLDVVGYADTNGYERDADKPHVWRYRDYVVRAFNEDKPYDRFLTEQLAGDELSDKTADSITATGFYRLGLWDDEPADPELAMYDNLDRIVATTGGAMLGLGIGCARCHDHKRDPILQEDYYSFLGFFRNINHMTKGGGPKIEATVSAHAEDIKTWQQRVSLLEKNIRDTEQVFLEKSSPDNAAKEHKQASGFTKLSYRQYAGHFAKLPNFDALKIERQGTIADGLIDMDLAGRDTDFAFVFDGELTITKPGRYTFKMDSDDGAQLTINGRKVITMDGIHGFIGYREAKVNLTPGQTTVRLEYFQAVGGRGFKLLWSGPGIGAQTLAKGVGAQELLSIEIAKQIETKGKDVLGKTHYEAYCSARRELTHLRNINPQDYKVLTITEENQVADTFVLARGNPHSKTTKVEPGFPEVLGFPDPQLPKTPSGRRSILAQWIVNTDNPLTARVMMNRMWHYHFGRGIVGSPNDFGKLGEQPSNQPLLDWLAVTFMENGWKIKDIHRLLMLSQTYRMSSRDDAAALARDASNVNHWRFNMRRLTAEEIRDSILWVDGSLNLMIGGPSIFAPIPPAVLATASRPNQAWGKSSPDDEVRRSMYIKIKRSLIHPMLGMHDVADTDASCPVRFTTTVPTQALTMMNSEFMHERAAVFAERLQQAEPTDPAKQVALGLRLVTQRQPSADEIKRGTDFIKNLQTQENMTADESLTFFCLMALNLNEFVYLD